MDDRKNLPNHETLNAKVLHNPKPDSENLQKRSCFTTERRKSASDNAPKTTKSTSNSTVASSRDARTTKSPRTAPLIDKSASVRHGIADWRADDADWTQLRADRYRPAWHLAALAFGLKPMEDLAMRLQAAGRTNEKKAYGDLIRTLENNLTRVDDSNRLQYVHDEANDTLPMRLSINTSTLAHCDAA